MKVIFEWRGFLGITAAYSHDGQNNAFYRQDGARLRDGRPLFRPVSTLPVTSTVCGQSRLYYVEGGYMSSGLVAQ